MENQTSTIDYKDLQQKLKSETDRLKKKINGFSYLRLAVFALAVLMAYLFFEDGLIALSVIASVMLIAFLVLVKLQVNFQNDYDFTDTKLALVENEISIENGGANVYPNGADYQNPNHPYTDDLDIFGAFSLFAYVNRCVTKKGKDCLANLFKNTLTKDAIEARQIAVSEIAKHFEETLNYRARLFKFDVAHVVKIETFFTNILSQSIGFVNTKFIGLGILVFSVLNPILLVGGIIWGGMLWSFLGVALLASATFYFIYKAKIDHIHESIGSTVQTLEAYVPNIKWIEEQEWQSDLLKNKAESIKSGQQLHVQISELSNILNSLNTRLNVMVGIFLNLFFQWDLRCLKRLAKWEQANEQNIIKGISMIGEFEAFISLATLNLNHPNWITPTIKDQYFFRASNLSHPLIKPQQRVANDFNLAESVTIDVITGSNMAGKSTFLRTVGINMVLAFTGANVCAKKFETSVFHLISYMRIKDSLASQTSTFKAEIDRLKMILDHTKTDSHSFVLVDEMLRGTNSRDKYLGSKVFIKALISQGIPGFIATHDLQIAELETEFPNQLRNFHFDIQIQDEEMKFDYKIKTGECKTFNASILLKAIGLQIDE